MKDVADLIGRLFIAVYFIYQAIDSWLFFKHTLTTMESLGIVWMPKLLLTLGIIFLFIGGLMVLIGYYANIGAVILMAYWIPYTFIVHSFWNENTADPRLTSLHFMLDFAVLGALLLLFANGSRKYSIKRILHVMKLPQ